MPLDVGLKTSVSLSSLPPGTPSDSPEHVRLRVRNDRPYHSLTKSHRRSGQSENWRKSWGSGISSDDKEFWTAFQADYEHLMSQTMVPEIVNIPKTRQTPPVWNLEECLDRFAQLYSWLKRFNDSIYYKHAAGTDWVIRAKEELSRHQCRLDEFNEGAATLIRECPHVKEEVSWRVRYVNDAWHGVETALATCDSADQLPRLRRWLSAMESKIKPVSFGQVWSASQLEARRRENAVLQRDVQEHAGVVASVVRSTSAADGVILERQYHNLLLRCFEWQCHIEALLARQTDKSPLNVSSDSDGEPLAKCARYNHSRLSDDGNHHHQLNQQCATAMDNGPDVVRRRARAYSPSRRCGIAKFAESISVGLEEMTTSAENSLARPGRNIANFVMKHRDTESENESKLEMCTVEDAMSSADFVTKHEDTESENESKDAMSSASEGWCFEQPTVVKKVVRSLHFSPAERDLSKAPSVQELVEAAESLVRMDSKYAFESRDASGESDTDVRIKPRQKSRAQRPLSLGCGMEMLPPSGARKLSSSESALNRPESPRKRRRKKFSSLRKNQSAYNAWMMNPLNTPPTIAKSKSFSAVNNSSDSSTESMTLPKDLESGDVTLVNADDTDEESHKLSISFRFGPDAGAVTVQDSEKIGGEEPSSLNTEDCWDPYQEKYSSEPYSEEVVDGRNLLECDDYGKYLDSPSDTSPGTHRRRRMRKTRSQRLETTDTEPEPEELISLLDRSRSQYREVEDIYLSSSYAIRHEELLRKCQENIQCLQVYLVAVRAETRIISDQNLIKVLNQWVQLQSEIERKCESERELLRQELEELRCELLLLADSRENCALKRFNNRLLVDAQIAQTKNDLNAVRERKEKIQTLHVAVHRFASMSEVHALQMKEDVVELYRLWNISFDSISRELCELQQVACKFDEFDVHMEQLQAAFRADRNTLRLVDEALKCGLTGADVADSVRDVAKLLSDKNLQGKCGSLLDDASVLLTEGGSLSDSGISDSGSELEMSERERRLAALKNLARHLEAVLEPGSLVLRQMMQSIEEAETELRGLQNNCREMIARSVGSADVPLETIIPKGTRSQGKRKKSTTHTGSSSSWFWRVVRAALPFQLALVALLCVACLLEPQCCDSVNNFTTGANFRYIRGPPPV